MECIICRESGNETLFDNYSCECKYKRHNSCWIDYVHSTDKVKCLLCRQEIKANKVSSNIGTIHISPRPRITPTPMLESYQNTEIFIIPEEPRSQPQLSREEQHRREIQNMTPQQKMLRIILLMAILAVIFLIFRFLLF